MTDWIKQAACRGMNPATFFQNEATPTPTGKPSASATTAPSNNHAATTDYS